MDKSALPSRLRESMFRRFETTIATIVRNYPNVTYVDRGNMSTMTVAARLRDAMLSLYKFEWPTSIVNTAKFRQEYNDIVVSHRDATISVGSKEMLGTQAKPICEVLPLEFIEEPTTIFNIDNVTLCFLCKLAASKALAKPVAVKPDFNIEVEVWEENFDVRIDKKEKGVYHIS